MTRGKDTRHRFWSVTQKAEGEGGMTAKELRKALNRYDFIGQLEEGEGDTHYRHWQILVDAGKDSTVRFSTLKKCLPVAHIEPAKSPAALHAYVTKPETRVAGVPPLIKGENWADVPKKAGSRTDLEELRRYILDSEVTLDALYIERPEAAQYSRMCESLVQARDRKKYGSVLRPVKTSVYIGTTGTGKTRAVFAAHGMDSICRVTHYGSGKFDAYAGQKVLFLDEFRGQLPIELLLTLLDIYPVNLPARYHDRVAAYENVAIASNVPVHDWYPDAPVEQLAALERRLTSVYSVEGLGVPVPIPRDEIRASLGIES